MNSLEWLKWIFILNLSFLFLEQCESIFNPQPGNCTDETIKNYHFDKSENECVMKEQLPCGSPGFITKEECEIECIGMYIINN